MLGREVGGRRLRQRQSDVEGKGRHGQKILKRKKEKRKKENQEKSLSIKMLFAFIFFVFFF